MNSDNNILDIIVSSARKRVERDKQAGLPKQNPWRRIPFQFEKELRGEDISFICEIKKASPSKGILSEDFPYLEIAREYESGGAAAISVLTEPDFFQGSDRYLSEIRDVVKVPLLRKDFIIDRFQIEQSARLGADAILLICSILSPSELTGFIREADSFGLSCLVEIHDERELEIALAAGARVIGVNNRDLKTFDVDMNNSIHLRRLTPKDKLFVSESGIKDAGDISVLRRHRVDAVLVGEALMSSPDRKEALKQLKLVM